VTTREIFADRPSRVESMTGLTSDQVDRLVVDVYAHGSLDPARRRAVGPYRAVLIVLLYLRHNLSQALLAELFGCSQPTVSCLAGRLTPVITAVLTPNAEQVGPYRGGAAWLRVFGPWSMTLPYPQATGATGTRAGSRSARSAPAG